MLIVPMLIVLILISLDALHEGPHGDTNASSHTQIPSRQSLSKEQATRGTEGKKRGMYYNTT